MATIANLNILLNLDDKASGALNKAGRNIQQWGQSLQNVGAGLTAGVTAPILGMAVIAVKAASDLQESMSAVQQVYGSAAETVVKRSEEAAVAMGLSQNEYLQSATVLGVYGDTLGLTDAQTADFSNSLIGAAADLGSFYNANTPEVLDAMQSALRGEFDPLERFGIQMTAASLEAYAMEQGIWDGNDAMTAQQKILAAQGFILDNMGNATGNYALTADGLANTMKTLKAQLKNTAAAMGQVLLPMVTKASKLFSQLITRFQNISPEWQKWIVLIGLAVAAIGPFLLVLGTILTMLPAIGAALAILLGPIGLVIAAIALLAAAYFGNWWGFRDAVDAVAGAIANAITWFGSFTLVSSTLESVVTTVTGLFDRITGAIGKIGTAILSGDWRTALAGIGDLLSAPAKAIGEFVKGIETGFDNVDRILDGVGNMFTDFGRIIQEVFQGDFSGAFDVLRRMVERVPAIFMDAFALIPWTSIIAAVSDAIAGLPVALSTVGTVLYEKGGEMLTGFIDGVGAAIPGLTALLSVLWSVAKTAVGDLSETLIEKGKQLLVGVRTGWTDNLFVVETNLGMLGDKAIEAVGDLTSTLFEKGLQLMDGVLDGWEDGKATLGLALGALGKQAVEAVGDLSSTLWGAGTAIVQGLVDGIRAGFQGVRDVVAELVGLIPGPVRGLLGISSPSRVMMGIGGFVAEGMALGIQRGIPQIEIASRGMAAAASSNVQADFSGQGGYGRGGGGFNNYGSYYEADRQWSPESTLNSYSIARSR